MMRMLAHRPCPLQDQVVNHRTRTHVVGMILAVLACLGLVTPAWGATPGPAYAWGLNYSGQLGTGGSTDLDFSLPAAMAAPGEFSVISAGTDHGCGLDEAGEAWCWGDNTHGQLGNGTLVSTNAPVRVAGGRVFNEISAGDDSTCAITDDLDAIYCWGKNADGQLGSGTTTSSNVPVQVVEPSTGFTDILSISVGTSTACAIVGQTPYCWGDNYFGQLGNGTTTDELAPRAIADFVNREIYNGAGNYIVQGVFAVGSTVYAATFAGLYVSTDGGNSFTQRDDNSFTANDVYANDSGSTIYIASDGGLKISTNSGASYVTKDAVTGGLLANKVNDVYAVGSTVYAATEGGLSITTNDGTTFTNRTTTNGLGDNVVRGIFAVGSTVYAATSGGLSISTNGGDTFTNRTTANGLGNNIVHAVYVEGSTVYAATEYGLSISTNGGTSFTNRTTANGLGLNSMHGVFAVGSKVYAATNGGGLSVSTDSGATFTTYTTASGLGSDIVPDVYAVGSTVYAATEGGLSISLPDYEFVDVSVGGSFACGVTRASGATGPGVCWGDNNSGLLGRGTTGPVIDNAVPRPIARPVSDSSDLNLQDIASSRRHSCALTSAGGVYCWGDNTSGQLGIGSTTASYSASAVTIPGSAAVRGISSGWENSCALTDQQAYCWGSNAAGQLGNSNRTDSTIPVAVNRTGIDPNNSPTQVTSGDMYSAFIVKPRMTFPAGTAFSNVQAGGTSSATVTARNNTQGDLAITGASVTGAGITLVGTTCSGTLSAGAVCTTDVEWSPTAAGALSASLNIAYTGNSSSVPLTGTATARPTSPGSTSTSSEPSIVAPVAQPVQTVSPTATSSTTLIAGRPDNPPIAQVLAPGLVLVSVTTAGETPTRLIKREPTTTLKAAPVLQSEVGRPISLVAQGLSPATQYLVKVRVSKRYVTLGGAMTDSSGMAQLPVFTSSRAERTTLALVDPITGQTSYLKVSIQRRAT